MKHAMIVSAVIVGAASVVLTTDDASACSPPVCVPAHAAPAANATIPASAAALFVRPSAGFNGAAEVTVAIVAAGDVVRESTVVAHGRGGFLIYPGAELGVGSYKLRYAAAECGFGADGGVSTVEVPFSVTPPLPLPTSAGTLRVGPSRVEAALEIVSGGPCTWPIRAAVVDLSVTPSAELAPYGAVVRWTTHVDGNLWAESDYGAETPAAIGNGMDPGRRRPLRLFAACAADSGGGDVGLSQGRHRVSVLASIAGTTTTMAALEADVELLCSGTPSADPGGADDHADAAGPRAGCAVSPAGAGQGGMLGAVFAAVALALSARRRRRG